MSSDKRRASAKLRIAVVTPFLDKRHGTERCVAEQVERLVGEYGYEVHVYSGRVEDVEAPIVWHSVPAVHGPHLVRYVWWFLANHAWRWWDRYAGGLRCDLIYSPGINCLDAHVISVHIVFAAFYRQVRMALTLSKNPPRFWPRLLHRRGYYRLIMFLERLVYPRHGTWFLPVSQQVAGDLKRFYSPKGNTQVIYHGVDLEQFNPQSRRRLRTMARQTLGLSEDVFILLLIGNDWKNKGLVCLLEALSRLDEERFRLLVVGQDDRGPFEATLTKDRVGERVHFLPLRADVEFYYAAADCYVAPSLEDAFALPVLEAMACGLPVIVSSHAGANEIVTDGADALILKDPRDPTELATVIRRLLDDPNLCERLGKRAAATARTYTWDRNAAELHGIFEGLLGRS